MWDSLSPDRTDPLLAITIDSGESSQPLLSDQDIMSSIPSRQGSLPGGLKDQLGTREALKKMREESAAKREATRIAKGQSNPSSPQAFPSKTMERRFSQSSVEQAPRFPNSPQQQPPFPPVTHPLPSLMLAGGPPPMPYPSHPPIAPNWVGGPQSMPPIIYPLPTSTRAGPQPLPSSIGVSPSLDRAGGQQSLSLAPLTMATNQDSRRASSTGPLPSREQFPAQVHSLRAPDPRTGTRTPEIIPDKLDYQVQDEPERLQVQPALISTELPLPMRSSQSVPHTPATPSRLSMHQEASPSQMLRLEPRNLGAMEFIVPLCMQKRILQQYVDTIQYYPAAIKESMTQQILSEKSIESLNELLCRLANVTTHIGLEGGGPSSQDSVRSEQEAFYAEISSEKFRFLSHLFQHLRNDDMHVAIVAQPGQLHDIVELFLKGKRIHYNRPGTYSKSNLGSGDGRLHVSVITSREEGQPTHLTRNADLVIALDETFDATNQTVVDLRRSNTNLGRLTPVIRLIVYSSIEHLDLCFPRTLEPINRLRKLIFCLWHTQSIVGELQEHQAGTQESAAGVVAFLRSGGHPNLWKLPSLRPIENIPFMDSDSSLSDAMSDVSANLGRPQELAQKCWPNKASATVGIASTQVLSSGKRPFVSFSLGRLSPHVACL